MATLLACGGAAAGWREDMGVFRVGIVAKPGAGTVIEGADPIVAAYSKALGMPVELYVARDYADLIDAQGSGRIEYAIHSALSYATLALQCACVTPLAAPVSDDGTTGIRAALIARGDGPSSISGLKDFKVAFGPPDSVAGAMLPLAGLKIDGRALTGSEAFMSPVSSESEAQKLIVKGDVAAMFGFLPSTRNERPETGGTLDALAASGLTDAHVLWTSDFIRYGPHAVRMSLPLEARQALSEFLTKLRDSDERVYGYLDRRFGGGFAAVTPDEYLAALALARSVVSLRNGQP